MMHRTLTIAALLAFPAGVAAQREIARGSVRVPTEKTIVAETVWIGGGVAGDFNDNANWTNQTPDSTHTPAIFDGGSSQMSATLNLDRGAADFRLITRRDYTGNIGSSGSPLKWRNTYLNGLTYIGGSGSVYMESSSALYSHILVDSLNPRSALHLTGGNTMYLCVRRGCVTIYPQCEMQGFLQMELFEAIVVIEESAAAELHPNRIEMDGGWLYNKRSTGATTVQFNVKSGMVEQTGHLDDACVLTTGAGAEFEYNPLVTHTGTPGMYIKSGMLDLRKTTQDLAFGVVVIGVMGDILGTAFDSGGSLATIDLRQEFGE